MAELTAEQQKQIRAARAKYAREYRRKNPEKNREAMSRYWLRKAEKYFSEHQKEVE